MNIAAFVICCLLGVSNLAAFGMNLEAGDNPQAAGRLIGALLMAFVAITIGVNTF